MAISRANICLSLQRALLGEIYPDIRLIAFRHNLEDSSFTLLYILDRKPNDNDYESMSVVLTEFMADFKFSDFSTFHQKVVGTLLAASQIPELKEMDLIIYERKEL